MVTAFVILLCVCLFELAVILFQFEYIKMQYNEIRNHDPLDPVFTDENEG